MKGRLIRQYSHINLTSGFSTFASEAGSKSTGVDALSMIPVLALSTVGGSLWLGDSTMRQDDADIASDGAVLGVGDSTSAAGGENREDGASWWWFSLVKAGEGVAGGVGLRGGVGMGLLHAVEGVVGGSYSSWSSFST